MVGQNSNETGQSFIEVKLQFSNLSRNKKKISGKTKFLGPVKNLSHHKNYDKKLYSRKHVKKCDDMCPGCVAFEAPCLFTFVTEHDSNSDC